MVARRIGRLWLTKCLTMLPLLLLTLSEWLWRKSVLISRGTTVILSRCTPVLLSQWTPVLLIQSTSKSLTRSSLKRRLTRRRRWSLLLMRCSQPMGCKLLSRGKNLSVFFKRKETSLEFLNSFTLICDDSRFKSKSVWKEKEPRPAAEMR